MTVEHVLFFILAASAVTSALLMVLQRNPVMSAIYLIVNFFCLATLYLLLRAQLLAVLEVIVYAGAIMVLVVFVIMLLNLGDEEQLAERFDVRKIAGVVVVGALLLELGVIFALPKSLPSAGTLHPDAAAIGTVETMGRTLFGPFLFPFEITSLLLLAAIVGAVILAKKS